MAPIPAYLDTTRIPTSNAFKTTMSTATNTTSTYKACKIGSGGHAVFVSLCDGPANDAAVAVKGNAFQYMLSTLQSHVILFSLSDIVAPLQSLLPIPIHAAEIEATSFGIQFRSALLTPGGPTTMQGIAFYNDKGEIVPAKMSVANRKGGDEAMKYIHVKSTVNVHSMDIRFEPTDEVSVDFYLALPQNTPTMAAPNELFPNGTPRRAVATAVTAGAVTIPIPRSMTKAVANKTNNTTYTGTMDFLEDYDTFRSVFTNNPTIYKKDKTDFMPLSQVTLFQTEARPYIWKLFSDIVWLDYVGTERKIGITPAVTARSLRAIKCNNWNPLLRKTTFLTPDEVMKHYLELIPLLTPHDPSTWGFHLFTLYYDAMTQEVRDMLEDTRGGYFFASPNLATVVTINDQMKHLRALRELASLAHSFICAQDMRFRKITKSFPNSGQQAAAHSATAFVSTGAAPNVTANGATPTAFVSPAESTMARYQPASSAEYPVDPGTGFVSKYVRGFQGCFGCGLEDHRFPTCPQRTDRDVRAAFHKNYLAHFPNRRKRNDDGSEPTQQQAAQVPRIYVSTSVSFVTSSHVNDDSRPMPIQVNNNLPIADFWLATSKMEPCVDLGCLIDTCAGLNSGNLSFHTHIQDTYPQCVVAFEQFDDANPFRPVKLGGAVTSPHDKSDHGRLTAVITYRTDITERTYRSTVCSAPQLCATLKLLSTLERACSTYDGLRGHSR